MLSRIENEQDFLNRINFSDEATFSCEQQSEYKHNCRILRSENPHTVQELEISSRKINVWCALSHDTVIGQFFFADTSVTANIYLDMLQIYALSQMQTLQPNVTFLADAGARLFEYFVGTGLPD
ncbi:hypothetical protein AVEN_185868-1 [Araneus ventricosus]|uniref:Uncharacterized protein n=1 Tax=Araneus ventricosus TaxID=182803 RepID=A0A4Y2J558_ARAVE|nr:hypothetical protein AVEN_185868-1 [Araneus ventricosus]